MISARSLRVVSVVVLAVWVATTSPSAQTFRTATDAVRVDVMVTERGRPVTDLAAPDFELRDNGVLQKPTVELVENSPVLLSLVLDASASVRGEALRQLIAAVGGATAALEPDDYASLLTFSDRIVRQVPASREHGRVVAALGKVEGQSATALYDGVLAALSLRAPGDARVVTLVFSDGDDTVSWSDPRQVLAAAQRSDRVVYGVTLGSRLERRDLRAALDNRLERDWFARAPVAYGRQFLPIVTAETGGDLLVAGQPNELRDAFTRVVSGFKRRYVLSFTPTGVAADGWHALDVEVRRAGASVVARRGYLRDQR